MQTIKGRRAYHKLPQGVIRIDMKNIEIDIPIVCEIVFEDMFVFLIIMCQMYYFYNNKKTNPHFLAIQ